MNKKIVVLGGGYSDEREVSSVSSREISNSLSKRGYETYLLDPADFDSYNGLITKIKEIDCLIVFIGLHGAEGEDGRIQALLEMNKIPFTGSGFKASSLAMDKYLSGIVVASIDLPVPPHRKIKLDTQRTDDFYINHLPLVVKPNDSGSSVGIRIVNNMAELEAALCSSFEVSEEVLCEQFIAGSELTVTVLNGKALPVLEIKPKNGWYDYTNKYTKGNTEYLVPAPLSKEETINIQAYSEKIFQILGCEVYARVDFRYDGQNFYFLEVNTLPGMTSLSLTPMAAKAAGLNFDELLVKIVELSLNKLL